MSPGPRWQPSSLLSLAASTLGRGVIKAFPPEELRETPGLLDATACNNLHLLTPELTSPHAVCTAALSPILSAIPAPLVPYRNPSRAPSQQGHTMCLTPVLE